MNSNQIGISIIMPLYNKINFVHDSIKSVLSQSFKNWELVVVDDGSIDGSGDVVKHMSNGNKNIKYFYQENKDQLHAINFGIDNSTGRLIMILHADDCLVDSCLERMYYQLINSLSDGLFSSYMIMNESGKVLKITQCIKKFNCNIELIKCLINYGSNSIGDPFFIKRESIEQLRKNYLENNLIYYFNYKDLNNSLKLEATQCWYKYRVFDGNYANSEVGSFVLYTGQIRTVSYLIKHISIRSWAINRYCFKLIKIFKLFYWFITTSKINFNNLTKYFKHMRIALRRNEVAVILLENIIFSLEARMKLKNFDKVLIVENIGEVYKGADARYVYNNLILKKNVNSLYYKLFNEQYTQIECKAEYYDYIQSALDFYSLYTPVFIKDGSCG